MVAIVTAYQSSILHSAQHAGASVALSAVVVEGAVEELMYGYGLVQGARRRLSIPSTAVRTLSSIVLSRAELKKFTFHKMVECLSDASFLDTYLKQRIVRLRKARNTMMHSGQHPTPSVSGEALTVARDLLRLCTNEAELSITASWSYRC